MTPRQRDNFRRLLRPRHIAVFGGRDAEVVAGECARIGFEGKLWPVNPKRADIGGHRCFARVEDLPEAPDAVFVAVPRDAAIDTVAALAEMGAGGVVCYTAGFGETGPEGAAAEAKLIEAAGDLALVGPNCYGVVNFIDRAALWPFPRGGASPGYGAAIITQSGMLSSDLTMSQRSVPFAYMISAGNQAILRLEDFVDALCEEEGVRAIGLHIEGLKDVKAFEAAARRALERGIPIVALKTGSSNIGAALTVSHTGSLSGTDELYRALFDRLGIIRVTSPAQLLETLKFLCIAGVPRGASVAGFTCSGGGATMLADHAETIGLEFCGPKDETANALRDLLPSTATVTNPLDYTTPIWGNEERLRPVFETALADDPDAAVIVQDYPLPGLDEGKQSYLNDARAFIDATRGAKIPAAICSTLPESIDADTREFLVREGVAPMQGIHETLNAIAGAAWYGKRRGEIEASPPAPLLSSGATQTARCIDEGAAKDLLRGCGITVPEGHLTGSAAAADAAEEVGFPVAAKMVHESLTHKTEVGAVALNLRTREAVSQAITEMRDAVTRHDPSLAGDRFLVERMAPAPVAELMVSVRTDPQFGAAMTLASGGILVELAADATTLLLPATHGDIVAALDRLKVAGLLDGYRGKAAADRHRLANDLLRIAEVALDRAHGITELEINPLFVLPTVSIAIDALISVRPGAG